MQKTFVPKVIEAFRLLDQKRQAQFLGMEQPAEGRLYDGFFDHQDKAMMFDVREATEQTLADLEVTFADNRLNELLPHYKARNYPRTLHDEARAEWEKFRQHLLLDGGNQSRAARFFGRLAELSQRADLTAEQRYVLEELQLYGQSIMPVADEMA